MHYIVKLSTRTAYFPSFEKETGRAGRDGKPSVCVLYFAYSDTTTLKKFITDSEGSWDQKRNEFDMLKRVVQFGLNKTECRRHLVLQYFGENFPTEQCKASCDNCLESTNGGGHKIVDVTQHAKNIVEMVRGARAAKVTQTMFIDTYKGSKAKNVRPFPTVL